MNIIGYCLSETRLLQGQVLGQQWFAPKLVPCVDQTDARSQPCELTANYESELPPGIGHERPSGPASCLLPAKPTCPLTSTTLRTRGSPAAAPRRPGGPP